MNLLDAVETVLAAHGKPLHYGQITQRVLEQNLWHTEGQTPQATLNARLAVDIRDNGSNSRFQRTSPGVFALRAWGLPEVAPRGAGRQRTDAGREAEPDAAQSIRTLSFTDAAEATLERFAAQKPMHYRAITKKALELGWIHTEGQTPEATLYAQILTEIKRRLRRGDTPRFVMHGRGYVGLSKWTGSGVPLQIERHNAEVRKRLHAQLRSMSPADFEALVGQLLGAVGFEEVEVTARAGDGGIDVRGTLVVGDVIRTRMAVQVKRWKHNVQAPVVQQVRGSLGTHEHGLIITTSDFSSGARSEAERPNAVPVALMNGDHLVTLLIENDIGVHRTSYDLIELGEAEGE